MYARVSARIRGKGGTVRDGGSLPVCYNLGCVACVHVHMIKHLDANVFTLIMICAHTCVGSASLRRAANCAGAAPVSLTLTLTLALILTLPGVPVYPCRQCETRLYVHPVWVVVVASECLLGDTI